MSDGDRLLDHEYDGIEEYDNPLPGWWSWIFVATIVFSLGYWLYYQIGPGLSDIALYDDEVRVAAEHQARLAPPPGASVSEESLRALARDARAVAGGREIFATRCMPCHGPEGQGVVGPNLTDDYWIHGRTLVEIRRTISEGVPEKGMVPWRDQLKPDEISGLAAYVSTLAGTKPANPKAPEGVNSKGEAAPATPPAN
jgi:cytochrome c oxidase cbb3-type subunit 3